MLLIIDGNNPVLTKRIRESFLSKVEVPEITHTTNKKAHGKRERSAIISGIRLKFSGFRLY